MLLQTKHSTSYKKPYRTTCSNTYVTIWVEAKLLSWVNLDIWIIEICF